MTTPYEQAWDEVYGTPEAWEHERDDAPIYEYGDVFAQELADTRDTERAEWRRDHPERYR